MAFTKQQTLTIHRVTVTVGALSFFGSTVILFWTLYHAYVQKKKKKLAFFDKLVCYMSSTDFVSSFFVVLVSGHKVN